MLTARGHCVHIYCIGNIPGTIQEEIVDGTVIHRYPQAYGYRQPLLKIFRRSPSAVLKYALSCRSIDPGDFDCFIFNQWPLAHILLAPPSVRTKAAIDWCEYRNGALFGFFQKYLPRLTSGNVANSLALKHAFEARSGRKFEVLPSGIFLHRYRSAPATERRGILYLGRIERHKNLLLMVSAYESLRSKGYEGSLRIAGTGTALPRLRRIVNGSAAAKKIDLLGAVTPEQKIELLSTAEVFLLTSQREGFPRVIAEAMASGLPVVTVDYPENGARDVVRQYGIGRIADPTSERIAEAVLGVISEWKTYSTACISASSTLSWEVLCDRLLEIVDNLQRDCA